MGIKGYEFNNKMYSNLKDAKSYREELISNSFIDYFKNYINDLVDKEGYLFDCLDESGNSVGLYPVEFMNLSKSAIEYMYKNVNFYYIFSYYTKNITSSKEFKAFKLFKSMLFSRTECYFRDFIGSIVGLEIHCGKIHGINVKYKNERDINTFVVHYIDWYTNLYKTKTYYIDYIALTGYKSNLNIKGELFDDFSISNKSWCAFASYLNSNWKYKDVLKLSFELNINKEDYKSIYKESYKDIYERYRKNKITNEYAIKTIYDSNDIVKESIIEKNIVVNGLFELIDNDTMKFKADRGTCGINLERGSLLKRNVYNVFEGGFIRLCTGSYIVLGLVEKLSNIDGEDVCYALRVYDSVQKGNRIRNSNGKWVFSNLYDTYEECMESIRFLEGKNLSEHNYLKDLKENHVYFRYCSFIGLREYNFSTCLFFKEGTCMFLRYSGKFRITFVKPGYNKQVLWENLKKAIKLPLVRKFLVRREYIFNIYKTSSTIAARLNLNRTYIGKQVDLSKFLEESKNFILKDVVFCISCINKATNTIEQDLVVQNGEIKSIDGCIVDMEQIL